MKHAVRRVWSKYAVFSGRASRPEFWWWWLFTALVLLVTQVLDAFIIMPLLGFDIGNTAAGQPLSALVSLVFLLPNIAVLVRRLHDTNRSGWWFFIALIPVVGVLVLIYFYVQPSDEGRNGFGEPDPLPRD